MSDLKNFFKKFFITKTEDLVVDLLTELALRSDNKVDDRLVEAVVEAIRNKSYMTAIKNFKK